MDYEYNVICVKIALVSVLSKLIRRRQFDIPTHSKRLSHFPNFFFIDPKYADICWPPSIRSEYLSIRRLI